MPTIAAGTSPNITLTAGQQLAFSAGGSGLVTVLRVGAASPLRSVPVGAQPVTIGPFGFDHIVTVYAEKGLTYTVVLPNAPTPFPPLQAIAQDPVTGWQYAGGSLVSGAGFSAGSPNTVLTDTVNTYQQLAILTIPGGRMSATSLLRVSARVTHTGNDTKNLVFRAGPVSGTFATAPVAFGGQTGLSTNPSIGFQAEIWNDGSLALQRATPAAQANSIGQNASAFVTGAIDTSLDWNLYLGWQSAVQGGAPQNSVTLRRFWAELLS